MWLVYSVDGVPIRLTAERWDHICRRHPEMQGHQRKVLEAVANPESVLEGDFGEKLAVRFYRVTSVGAKHLVVAYKEVSTVDSFIVTAYFARRVPRWRTVLWKQ